jgi:hypothetical protein
VIVTFSVQPEHVARLDALVTVPKGRSAWLRRAIDLAYQQHLREQDASRKAPTPERKRKNP